MARRATLARRERMAQVLDLAQQGASYRAIGDRLHISHTQARRDHTDALKEVTMPLAEEVRKVLDSRLEDVYLMAVTKARKDRDTRAMQVALNTIQERAKFYGVSVPSGQDGVTAVKSLLDRLLED